MICDRGGCGGSKPEPPLRFVFGDLVLVTVVLLGARAMMPQREASLSELRMAPAYCVQCSDASRRLAGAAVGKMQTGGER